MRQRGTREHKGCIWLYYIIYGLEARPIAHEVDAVRSSSFNVIDKNKYFTMKLFIKVIRSLVILHLDWVRIEKGEYNNRKCCDYQYFRVIRLINNTDRITCL